MSDLTFSQLEGLWISAGGNKAVAPIMAAIALAESSGNPQAINPIDNGGRQTSWGLWQISNGTHNMPVANILNPQVNAQQAVAKYQASGFGPWGTYASGAYLKFLPKGYVAPSTPPGGGGGGGGGGGAGTSAQLSSSWSTLGSDIADPFSQVFKSLGSLISAPADIATSVTRLAKDFNSLVGLINNFFKDIEWLFVPSHWVRIFAFFFGVAALIPGVWALMQTGSGKQGDVTMAIGILLVTVAGVLLFIAFHNLPTSVTDLAHLLGYIAQGIQGGAAPSDTVDAASLGNSDVSAQSIAQATQNALGPGS